MSLTLIKLAWCKCAMCDENYRCEKSWWKISLRSYQDYLLIQDLTIDHHKHYIKRVYKFNYSYTFELQIIKYANKRI